jgi:hypothetical protein
VNALAFDSSGTFLYLAGDFISINSKPHLRLARLRLLNATSDETWTPAVGVNNAIPGVVQRLALTSTDDAAVIAGNFNAVNNTARNYVAKVSTASGQLDATWAPDVPGYDVVAIVAADGFVYFGGPQVCCDPGFLLRADAASGNLDSSFMATFDHRIAALTVTGAGVIDAFGDFAYVNGVPALGRATVTSSGNVIRGADFEQQSAATAMATEPSGAGLIAGNFQKVDQQYRAGLVRLEIDGTVDPNFNPPLFEGSYSYDGTDAFLALASDPTLGFVYVGGSFQSAAGLPRPGLARLSAVTGALDSSWAPAIDALPYTSWVQAIVVDQSSVYIGGRFTKVNGVPQSHFAKLTSSGMLDPIGLPLNGDVTRMALDGTSLILVGTFLQPAPYIAKRGGPTCLNSFTQFVRWNFCSGLCSHG